MELAISTYFGGTIPKSLYSMRLSILFLIAFLTSLSLTNCGDAEPTESIETEGITEKSTEEKEAVVEAFIMAEDDAVIEIGAGFYEMETQLIIDDKTNITIKGAGMDETILSFKTLAAGGEGIKLSGKNITVEDLTVVDAPGDCIKAQHCDGITFRRVNTTWTNDDKSKNGTYGLYPVQCSNVLVEECEVSHSRDAGVYVGQSENIIVRNCYVFENVAGIEIENSDNAEVYDNLTENNTSGILVFNLPGLPKAFGSGTRIYNNKVYANNHENFAVAISETDNGNAVTQIPPGTGMVILAGNDVEVFNNEIKDHKTIGIAVASYHVTQFKIPEHEGWTPFTTNVYIHDNTYERKMAIPDVTKTMGQLVATQCRKPMDIIYDGIFDPERGGGGNPMNICIKENKEDFRFVRFDLPEDGDLTKIGKHTDLENFECEHPVSTDVSMVE